MNAAVQPEMLDKQLSSFEKSGYLVVKNFFSTAAVHRCRASLSAALETDVSASFKRWGIDLFAPGCVQKINNLLNNSKELSVSDKHILLGHFPLEVRLSKFILPLVESLGKSPLLQALLGSRELFMHMPPMMRFVLPGYNQAGVPAHQDATYNRHLSSFITVWTPMVPITQACGGLIIYEGSRHMRASIDESQEEGWLPSVDVRGFERLQLVDLNEGDIVILSSDIVHASASNSSNCIRLSADFRVFGRNGASQKKYLDLTQLQVMEPAQGSLGNTR